MIYIYGGNSFIGRYTSYALDCRTVGRRDCDFTYEDFTLLLDSPMDGIVYCRGIYQEPNSYFSENPELFSKNTFDFFVLIEKIEHRLSKDCSIVYISSGHANRASDQNPYYASSKAAVNSFVVSYGKKLSKMNVEDGGTRRINAVAPEAVKSPMISNIIDVPGFDKELYISTRPSMRLLDVQEVVEPIKFLLGKGSSGINGIILTIGGVK
jgi:NAD(P)-dependent dehydrogenase (short-subunit alcohol dehydrogenase family)